MDTTRREVTKKERVLKIGMAIELIKSTDFLQMVSLTKEAARTSFVLSFSLHSWLEWAGAPGSLSIMVTLRN